jgi:hypothetical protein
VSGACFCCERDARKGERCHCRGVPLCDSGRCGLHCECRVCVASKSAGRTQHREVEDVRVAMDQLRDELKTMRATLAWYADRRNYRKWMTPRKTSAGRKVRMKVEMDMGERARVALGREEEESCA